MGRGRCSRARWAGVAAAMIVALACSPVIDEGPQPTGVADDDPATTIEPIDPTTTSGLAEDGTSSGSSGAMATTMMADTDETKLDVAAPPGGDLPVMTGEDCEELAATIRDFSQNHPDFEDYTGTMAY